jgi:thiol-disulfide isomerase/thioredoxin
MQVLIKSTSFLLFTLLLITEFTFAQSNIATVRENEIKSLINKRDGKILLVNIWATWCVPCREEFPDLVKVYEKYKDKVDVAGISVDYPDEVSSKILPFVKKNQVNFPIYVNGITSAEKFIDIFDKDWNGAIPATFIYDKNGKQIKKIYGKEDFDYFDKLLSEVLKSK